MAATKSTAPIVPAGSNSLAFAATRRGLLGAMAAAPALALPVIPAMASTHEWDAALAAHHDAEAVLRRAGVAHSRAQEAYFAERPQHNPYEGSVLLKGDTAESFNARLAKERYDREEADLVCRKRHRVDETEADLNAVCPASTDATRALLETPAPNMRAAILKLEIAAEEGEGFDHVLADLRRLAREG